MKKLGIFLICLFMAGGAFAAERATLENGSGEEIGTSGSPMYVSLGSSSTLTTPTINGATITGTWTTSASWVGDFTTTGDYIITGDVKVNNDADTVESELRII